MARFCVIAYDADRQEVFFDSILADSAYNAAEIVGNVRPRALPVTALEPTRLRKLADAAESLTEESFVQWLVSFQEPTEP
jgi:hypothetical protein